MKCDLVLGGGGVRGFAHVGAMAALVDGGYEVHRVAGASAGAIAGALAVSGATPTEMHDLHGQLDLRAFALSDIAARLSGTRAIGGLVDRFVDREDPGTWLEDNLALLGVRTFADLRTDDPDDGLPPGRPWRLVVRCLDIVQRRVVRLPWDYPRYGLDPDEQSVAQAVRASMSIPLVFRPVPIGMDTDDGDVGLLVDGGLTSGFPVSFLDRRDGRAPRWPTFALRLLPRPRGAATLPDGDVATIRAVIDTLRDAADAMEPHSRCDERRTMRIDTSAVAALDLSREVEENEALYQAGRDAVEGFLSTWDFAAYAEDCLQPVERQ